jgi:hypothetical protein
MAREGLDQVRPAGNPGPRTARTGGLAPATAAGTGWSRQGCGPSGVMPTRGQRGDAYPCPSWSGAAATGSVVAGVTVVMEFWRPAEEKRPPVAARLPASAEIPRKRASRQPPGPTRTGSLPKSCTLAPTIPLGGRRCASHRAYRRTATTSVPHPCRQDGMDVTSMSLRSRPGCGHRGKSDARSDCRPGRGRSGALRAALLSARASPAGAWRRELRAGALRAALLSAGAPGAGPWRWGCGRG